MPHLSPVREQAESYFLALQSRLAEVSSTGTGAGDGRRRPSRPRVGPRDPQELLPGVMGGPQAEARTRRVGGDVVCGHTGLMDAVLRQVFALAVENLRVRDLPSPSSPRAGMAAASSTPAPDVDILFVYDGILSPRSAVSPSGRCTSLWDMGLTLGHSVRSIGESMQAARVDTVTKTSFLESRPVAGDAGVADRFRPRWPPSSSPGRQRPSSGRSSATLTSEGRASANRSSSASLT